MTVTNCLLSRAVAANIQEEFLRHFQANFSPPDRRVVHNLVSKSQGLPISMLTSEQEFLDRPLTEGEVAEAMSQKSEWIGLRSDSIPVLFYQSFWSLTNNSVTKAVLSLFNYTSLILSLLIPKVSTLETVNDYRPMSLW